MKKFCMASGIGENRMQADYGINEYQAHGINLRDRGGSTTGGLNSYPDGRSWR